MTGVLIFSGLSALTAVAALVLSQLPPIKFWRRAPQPYLNVHRQIFVSHRVGNPRIGLSITIQNNTGRSLHIESLKVNLVREKTPIGGLSAANYAVVSGTAVTTVIFLPITLQHDREWSHTVEFSEPFQRNVELALRSVHANILEDIRKNVVSGQFVAGGIKPADANIVRPAIDIFTKTFLLEPGDYDLELTLVAKQTEACCTRKYRFTLYESDTARLKAAIEQYQMGSALDFDEIYRESYRTISVPIEARN